MAKRTHDIDTLRVADLREEASRAGITGASHMRKEQLVEALGIGPSPTGRRSKDLPGTDVLALLKTDHDKVKALFQRAFAAKSGDASIESLANEIAAELTVHAAAEEQIFYPALKAKGIDHDDDDAKDEVIEAYIEHGSVKQLIAQLKMLNSSDESYKAILQVMSEQVEHHVKEEESNMFKHARTLLDSDELHDIGQQILTFKQSKASSA